MLASLRSATLVGVDGRPVRVEVHVSTGLPAYNVVGLPDASGRESRERVRAALLSSDLPWPMQRITVNLAPGGLRKTGAGFELAVAIGLLVASDELPDTVVTDLGVLGELGLDGSVRRVPGVLALVDALRRAGSRRVIVPLANAAEAALVDGVEICPARTVAGLRACLKGEATWPEIPAVPAPSDRWSRRLGAELHASAGQCGRSLLPQLYGHEDRNGLHQRAREGRMARDRATAEPNRRTRSTWPTSAGSPTRGSRSRRALPVATTSCSSALPAPGRPCSPVASRRSSRASPARPRSR